MSTAKYFELLPQVLKQFFHRFPPHVQYAIKPVSTHSLEANPFLPNKHPVTLKYHNPVYSKRRMSVLFKLASRYGVQDLLPPIQDKLFFEEKYENKTFMKGVLLPKGHKHELNKQTRMDAMKKGIEDADKSILKVKGNKFARKLEQKKTQKVGWF